MSTYQEPITEDDETMERLERAADDHPSELVRVAAEAALQSIKEESR